MKNRIIVLVALLVVSITGLYAQKQIDPTTSIVNFVATNLGAKVKGNIKGMTGTVTFDASNLKSSNFQVSIPAKKIDTDNRMRDEHLQEEEFFDVKNHSAITFNSSSIKKTSSGYSVTGSLKMKAITKTVTIPFTVSGNEFKGKLTINRNDYNIGGDGFLNTIGDDIVINITCFVKS